MEKINRRNALGIVAKWTGASFIPFSWLIKGCSDNTNPSLLNPEYQSLLATIVDIILPETPESPGAKEANVHHFIGLIVEDCYALERKNIIILGLNQLLDSGFLNFSTQEQYDILAHLDEEANSPLNKITPYFKEIKSLTQWGYFSSKLGILEGLRYNPIPGYYKGCIPYNGEIAWF